MTVIRKYSGLALLLSVLLLFNGCGAHTSGVLSGIPSSTISDSTSRTPAHETGPSSESETVVSLPHITDEKTGLVIDYRIPDLRDFFSDEQKDVTGIRSLHIRNGALTYVARDGAAWTLWYRQLGHTESEAIYESNGTQIDGFHLRGFLPLSDTQYLLEAGTEVSPEPERPERTTHPSTLFILNIQDGSLVPAKQHYGYEDDYISYVAKVNDTLYLESFTYVDGESVRNLYRQVGSGSIQKLNTPTVQTHDDVLATESGIFIFTEDGAVYGTRHNEDTFELLLAFRHKGYSVPSIHGNHLFLEINLDEPGESNYILKINMLTATIENILVFTRQDEFIPSANNVHVVHSTISDGSDGRELGSIAFTQFCVFDWDGNLLFDYPPLENPGVLWSSRYAIYDDTLYYIEFDGHMDILKQSEPLKTPEHLSAAASYPIRICV